MANVIKHKRGSGSDPVANDLVVGEVAIRTDVGKLFTKMDNGSVAEIAGGGSDIAINTLSSSSATGGGSATFNGSAYRFTLSQPPSVSAQQLLVSINGVIQKPVAGTGQPSEGFSVDGTDIILGDAPATGSDFFILTFKSLGVSEPADNSVTSAKIVDGTIVNADINASAAIAKSKIETFVATNADNRLITGSGTANTLNGESELTYSSPQLKLLSSSAAPQIRINSDTSDGSSTRLTIGRATGSNNFVNGASAGDSAITFPSNLIFGVQTAEKMRIDSSGRLLVGTTDTPSKLTVDTDFCVVRSSSDPTINLLLGSSSSITQLYRILIDDSDSDKLQVRSNDSPRITMTAGGNVGIGTTSPIAKFDVTDGTTSISFNKTNNTPRIDFKSNNVSDLCQIKAAESGGGGVLQLFTKTTGGTATERVRIDTSGNLLLGATSYGGGGADPTLYIVGSSGRTVKIHASSGTSSLQLTTSGSNQGEDKGLQLAMSGTSGIITNHQDDSIQCTAKQSNTNNPVINFIKPNGPSNAQTVMIAFETGNQARGAIKSSSSDGGSPSFVAYSDYRIKTNIRNYTDGYNNIKAIPVKLFDMITDGTKDIKGWIAHEVQAYIPEAVMGEKDAVDSDGKTILQNLSYGTFMPDVVSALQTAIAKIETLETKVASLEAK